MEWNVELAVHFPATAPGASAIHPPSGPQKLKEREEGSREIESKETTIRFSFFYGNRKRTRRIASSSLECF